MVKKGNRMTKHEIMKEIIRQDGECDGIGCYGVGGINNGTECPLGISGKYPCHRDGAVRWLEDHPEEQTQRSELCVNSCAGITSEALEAGIIEDAIVALIARPTKDVTFEGDTPLYMGYKIWEDNV
jgi:hypothetical protein